MQHFRRRGIITCLQRMVRSAPIIPPFFQIGWNRPGLLWTTLGKYILWGVTSIGFNAME